MILHLLFLFLPLMAFGTERLVLVSVAPYVEIVDQLTEKSLQVELLVPAGFSSHTYEPTPKQILRASQASIWFTIGELFEAKAAKALQSENPRLILVDLRQGLSLIEEGHHHDHHHSADTHIWMSPKMMQHQVQLMAKSLTTLFPEIASLIEKNKSTLLTKLEKLDSEIRNSLSSHQGKSLFAAHPSYGYFCREYGLIQESIEFEGRDPTPKALHSLIQEAKSDGVRTIFIQKQYSTKAAELVASEIGAKLVMLDPYSEHYFESMQAIAKHVADGL